MKHRKIEYVSDVTEMTIDQLAQAAGMTVRNVRAHQSRGLLPPPRLTGRTGYYGPEHLALTRAITEPFSQERPEIVDAAELARPWGAEANPRLLERAAKLGAIR